jgi:hypothetical protein
VGWNFKSRGGGSRDEWPAFAGASARHASGEKSDRKSRSLPKGRFGMTASEWPLSGWCVAGGEGEGDGERPKRKQIPPATAGRPSCGGQASSAAADSLGMTARE